MARSMEGMNLQNEEIRRPESQVSVLHDQIKRVEDNHLVEMQRAKALIEKLQKSEKESSIGNTLVRVKEIIWHNIIDRMNEILPSIQIIFYQKELLEKGKEAISATNTELGDMPEIANRITKFLNARNKYELENLGVADRTETILQVMKMLTNKSLNVKLKEKCQVLELTVNKFINRIQPLHLPYLFVINEKLMDRGDYVKKLQGIATNATNLSNIKGNITGKALLEAINNQIYIQHEPKHVFLVKP